MVNLLIENIDTELPITLEEFFSHTIITFSRGYHEYKGMGGGGCGRAVPSNTGIPLTNLPNSRLPNQQNEKHCHRKNCSLNLTREETSNSINYKFS